MSFSDDNGAVYHLLDVMKEIPGSNIYYKDTSGVILWHNDHSVKDLMREKDDINGKTIFDLFCPETAKLDLEHDLDVISSGNMICKQVNAQLFNGTPRQYFVTKAPWRNSSGQIGGIIVNATNLKETVCQQFKTCHANNTLNSVLDVNLKDLHFNFKQSLKEMLLLANLIILGKTNKDTKSLCLELGNFAKRLLSDCDSILAAKNIFNTEQLPIILNKINLRKLIDNIFIRQMKSINLKNTKIFFTVSDQIPETIIGDQSRINKLLQLVAEALLKSALDFNSIDIKILCKIALFRKINSKNIIVSVIFTIENYLLENFLNDKQSSYTNLKKINDFSNSNDVNFVLNLVKTLIKELGGKLELVNNKSDSKIVICLPVEI